MAMQLMTLAGSPYGWRVQLALEHKQLDYELRVLSWQNGELDTPELRAMSPRGRVPVLRDGDFSLCESLAILAYLDRKYPGQPLFGTTAEETGRIWRWISEYTAYVDAAVERFIVPLYFGDAKEKAAEIRETIPTLATELATYEKALSATPFLAGDAPSAADHVVFPHVMSILRAASKPMAKGFDLSFLPLAPATAAWIARIEKLPGYEKTYPQNWR